VRLIDQQRYTASFDGNSIIYTVYLDPNRGITNDRLAI
jgi:hypothetical protein